MFKFDLYNIAIYLSAIFYLFLDIKQREIEIL